MTTSDDDVRAARRAVQAARTATPPSHRLELAVHPDTLPGVTGVAGVPVHRTTAVEPGAFRVFDRTALRYLPEPHVETALDELRGTFRGADPEGYRDRSDDVG